MIACCWPCLKYHSPFGRQPCTLSRQSSVNMPPSDTTTHTWALNSFFCNAFHKYLLGHRVMYRFTFSRFAATTHHPNPNRFCVAYYHIEGRIVGYGLDCTWFW